ncbi:MAG TPA: PAS domain-containing protein, partial [Flavisolibacter sp.]|nr:PAS domain-containing protein [Flavisolibacter sp.]
MIEDGTVNTAFRIIYLLLRDRHFTLIGNWKWSLKTSEIFCSDIFFSVPQTEEFSGITKVIIDPADAALLADKILTLRKAQAPALRFRIITSFGKAEIIELIYLHSINYTSKFENAALLEKEQQYRMLLMKKQITIQNEKLIAYKRSEYLQSFGVWYTNIDTCQTVYSDNIFTLHGLSAQSLNAHPNTFLQFIHPDDYTIVLETVDKAYRQSLPFSICYRIIRSDGEIRFVRQSASWMKNDNLENIFLGTVQDISDQKRTENELKIANDNSLLHQKLLYNGENIAGFGHWHINLNTRKVYFSENFCRIYGLKQNDYTHGIGTFLLFVHSEDYKMVGSAIANAMETYEPIDIEYRILRRGTRLCFLKLKSDTVFSLNNDPVITGILYDETSERIVTDELHKTKQSLKKERLCAIISNEISGCGTWSYEAGTDKIQACEKFFRLFGLRP